MRLPTTEYSIALPDWIDDALAGVPAVIDDVEGRMRLVHTLAQRNWREGNGGPFAALVAESDSGRIVSVGVNVVLASGVSSAHAEVTALALAQRVVGDWDLGGEGRADHELVVNWRPCVQCYGAVLWSGVRRLVVAGSGPELEQLTGFDEGPMREDWAAQFQARGIAVLDGVLRDGALETFAAYRDAVATDGITVYNARRG
ncbi:MAG TPA: nucleoside deaminase [Solirubrobacteraceae bacterium]|nr:nucleoside deaminase [Solirubrobacteraceae bacterium]